MYWTNYAENKILRTFLGTTAVAPAAMYVALFLSNPGEAGGGTEISYSGMDGNPGYARQPIAFTSPATETGGTSIMNVADIGFAVSGIAAGTVTHCALFDSVSGGNMWAYNTLDEPIVVSAGVGPLIQAQEWNYITSGNFSNMFKTATLNLLRGQNMEGFLPHIALYNGNPDSGGAELSGGNYARFAITFGTPEVQSSGQSMIAVSAPSSSPRSNTNWGTWTHTAICNAASGGEVVAYLARDTDYVMGAGKAAFVNTGDISIGLS